MTGPPITEQYSIFPSRNNLAEVEAEALSQLPITSPNNLIAILRLQQNTLIKELNAERMPII
tara:strand:+ start:3355 stop:3540 length:186 start_codon:yes stop_codon:yes gene_type:complete